MLSRLGDALVERAEEEASLDPDVDMPHKLDQSVLFSPVTIKAEGVLKVRVEIAGHLIKAGTLEVEKAQPHRPAEGGTVDVEVTRNAL